MHDSDKLYNISVKKNNILPDEYQSAALEYLQKIYNKLNVKKSIRSNKFNIFYKYFLSNKHIDRDNFVHKGIYIYGDVGRGKTYLLDLFFNSLIFKDKLRLHFHHFMKHIHDKLREMSSVTNPISIIVKNICKEIKVICLDEFFVEDIADAMILRVVFENLFKYNVIIIITSNTSPSELYKNGLHRRRFLPTIDILNTNLKVFHMGGGIDYRLQLLKNLNLFYYPNNFKTDSKLKDIFFKLSPVKPRPDIDIGICNRFIRALYVSSGIVWFSFKELCCGPRGKVDYIEISSFYHTVFLSNVPILNEFKDDEARRFIALIDEFYDRRVKIVISAETESTKIYTGKKLKFEFKRTYSRLHEMCTKEYLSLSHRAII